MVKTKSQVFPQIDILSPEEFWRYLFHSAQDGVRFLQSSHLNGMICYKGFLYPAHLLQRPVRLRERYVAPHSLRWDLVHHPLVKFHGLLRPPKLQNEPLSRTKRIGVLRIKLPETLHEYNGKIPRLLVVRKLPIGDSRKVVTFMQVVVGAFRLSSIK